MLSQGPTTIVDYYAPIGSQRYSPFNSTVEEALLLCDVRVPAEIREKVRELLKYLSSISPDAKVSLRIVTDTSGVRPVDKYELTFTIKGSVSTNILIEDFQAGSVVEQ